MKKEYFDFEEAIALMNSGCTGFTFRNSAGGFFKATPDRQGQIRVDVVEAPADAEEAESTEEEGNQE